MRAIEVRLRLYCCETYTLAGIIFVLIDGAFAAQQKRTVLFARF